MHLITAISQAFYQQTDQAAAAVEARMHACFQNQAAAASQPLQALQPNWSLLLQGLFRVGSWVNATLRP